VEECAMLETRNRVRRGGRGGILILSLVLVLFTSASLTAEEVVLCDRTFPYSVPGPGYKAQKLTHNGFDILVVKFPAVYSSVLQVPVVPNFSLVTERVLSTVTTQDYLAFKLDQIRSMPGFNPTPSHDDLLSCRLANSISYYYEYEDPRGAAHSCYCVFAVQDGLACCVTFDCTSDLYPSQRGALQSLLSSLKW